MIFAAWDPHQQAKAELAEIDRNPIAGSTEVIAATWRNRSPRFNHQHNFIISRRCRGMRSGRGINYGQHALYPAGEYAATAPEYGDS
jgi:hypothetical protein